MGWGLMEREQILRLQMSAANKVAVLGIFTLGAL